MQSALFVNWELKLIPFFETVLIRPVFQGVRLRLGRSHREASQATVGGQRTTFPAARNNLDLSIELFTRFSNLAIIQDVFAQPAVAQLVGRRFSCRNFLWDSWARPAHHHRPLRHII